MNPNAEELFEKYSHIGEATLYKMFNSVNAVARRHKIEVNDLIQYANTGLWLACINYNEEKSKFLTYAINSVKWHLSNRLRADCNIRYYKATEYKTSPIVNIVSMEIPTTDDSDSDFHDIVPSDTYLIDDAFESMCEKYLNENLTEQQKEIIKLRKLGYSTGEIGKMLGVSGQNIRYHLKNIRKKFDKFFMDVA